MQLHSAGPSIRHVGPKLCELSGVRILTPSSTGHYYDIAVMTGVFNVMADLPSVALIH